MAARTLKDIEAVEPDLDEARLDALTEDDIQAIKAQEGFAHRPIGPGAVVLPPAEIRERLRMTQRRFADALRIPLGTLRNWEQGRKLPDPAARSLLNAVARDPVAVLAALGIGGESARTSPQSAGDRNPTSGTDVRAQPRAAARRG